MKSSDTVLFNIKSVPFIKLLQLPGFVQIAQRGSYLLFQHPGFPQKIAIPVFSSNKSLSISIIRTILKIIDEAGIVSRKQFEIEMAQKK